MRLSRRWPILNSRAMPLGLVLMLTVSAFILADDRTDLLLSGTLRLALYSSAISVPLGFLIALTVYVTDLPYRRGFQLMIIALLFMPAYLQVAGWNAGFGLQGWFSRQVFLSESVALLNGWPGAVFVQSVVSIPWVALIIGAGLKTIPRTLVDQARLDLRPFQLILYLAMPMSIPSLIASTMWVIVMSSCDITITDVFQIRTFSEEIYTGFALGDDLGAAQIRAIPGVLLVAGLGGAAMLVCQSVTSSLINDQTSAWTLRLGRWRWPMFAIATVGTFVLAGVPVGNLIYKAGLHVSQVGDERIRAWSAVKFMQIMWDSPFDFSQEFAWSFALSQLAAWTVLAAALPLAWLAHRRPAARLAGWLLAVAGLSIPGPIVALGLGRLLNQPDSDLLFYLYDRTIVLPWITLAIRSFPFAFVLATVAVRRVPQELLDAAATDGANHWAQIRHIIVPQSLSAIACIWFVALAVSLADLSSSILAVPPGVTTVAIRVFNLVHYGVEDQLAGLCLWTMFQFTALATIVALTARRRIG